MLNPTNLLEIVSGRRRGLFAALIRSGLGCLTPFYRLAVWWRNRRFDIHGGNTVAVPVISIGNLTTGGTGKTPMVIWITQFLKSSALRVTIISRGYGRENTNLDRNDEALELEHRLPDVPHLQSPDRTRLANIAISEHFAQVIVLDDGFQHRKLNRDLDIVLIDATEPFGFERLLPRGLLREPLPSISRAQAIVLTRCDTINADSIERIRRIANEHSPSAIWATSKTVSESWLQFSGQQIGLSKLKGKKVLAICGIGNPKGFQHSLSQQDLAVSRLIQFPDHHRFTQADIEMIQSSAEELGVDAIVCTHKDLVKIGANQLGNLPVYALLIRIEFVDGEQELADLITERIAK